MMRRDHGKPRSPSGSSSDSNHNPTSADRRAPSLGDPIFGSTGLATELINDDAVDTAWETCPAAGRTFEESLLEAGIVDPVALAEAYSQYYLLPLFDPPPAGPLPIARSVAQSLSGAVCCDALIAPLNDDGTTLEIAIASPESLRLKETLEEQTGRVVRPMFAPLPVVERILSFLYADTLGESRDQSSPLSNVQLAANSTHPKHSPEPPATQRDTAEKPRADAESRDAESRDTELVDTELVDTDVAPSLPAGGGVEPAAPLTASEYLRRLLQTALCKRASEVHVEAFGKTCRVRLRVKGSLVPLDSPHSELFQAFVSQLGLLGCIDRQNLSRPSEGTLEVRHGRRRVQIDVDYCPTIAGAKVTLTPRGRDQQPRTLDRLGLLGQQRDALLEILAQPRGLLLVVAPPSGGKRTTLYAALAHLNTSQRALGSVEDAVRRRIPGVNQLRVAPERGLDVAAAIHAALRQQPDVLMISQLNDIDAVGGCLAACRSNRLILSAIEADNTRQALEKLHRFGLSQTSLAKHVLGILEQRVLPRCCTECQTVVNVDRQELLQLGFSDQWLADRGFDSEQIRLYDSRGCERCGGQGVLGEVAVFRLLTKDQLATKLATAEPNPTEGQIAETLLGHALLTAAAGVIRWQDAKSLPNTY